MAEAIKMPVTALLGANMFFSGVTFASTAPYAAIVGVESLGLNGATYAGLVSAGAIAGTFVSVLMGYFSDKLPDRRILVLIAALAGVLGHGVIYLFRSQLAFGISTVLLMPIGFAMFSQSFAYVRVFYNRHHPERADFMVSALRTVFTVAWAIVPPLAGYVAAVFSVFDVYLISTLSYLACGLIFALMMTDQSTRIANIPPEPKPQPAAGDRHRRSLPFPIIAGVVGLVVIMVSMRLVGIAMPLLMVNELGGNLTDVGLYAGIAAALELPFMIGWGYLLARLSKETILVFNALLYGLYLFLVCRAQSVSDVLWLQGLNAIATAALMSVNISYLQEAIKGRVGLSTSLIDVVAIAATLFSGVVFGVLSTGQDYRLVLLAAAIIAVTGALVMLAGNISRVGLVKKPA